MSIVWMLILGVLSYSGYFEDTFAKPPRFVFVIIATICLFICFYRFISKNKIRINFLIAIHMLRVPVEVVLYQLYLQNKVPILMTFKGYNFDIVIGVFAVLLLSYLLVTKRNMPKPFMIWWNVFGLGFLGIIVFIAVLSSPLPIQQFAFDQPNIAVLGFPYIYLPSYIVPVVFLSHILAIKRTQN
ncbi:hypothetical protein [Algoriphagus sp. D3-2-R+10]|uniref:hypothetical protein n=1 Tax=Algoriphagus aurantiacus TaxID=3103948 RepID=UPI002B4091C2|nr:hypothetical protein [Algoriphagus sp. D3-2-R+10]